MNLSGLSVCHVTVLHNRYDGRIFRKECNSLVKAGVDVTLIVNDELTDEVINNIKIVSLREKKNGLLKRILFLHKKVVSLVIQSGAKICHLHDPELLLLATTLKRNGIKVIFDSHEFYTIQIMYKEYLPRWCSTFVSIAYDRYQRYVFDKIDAVILPCTLRGSNPFEKCKAQTVVVSNYPLLEEQEHVVVKEKLENTICYAGGITKLRGIENMVEGAYKSNAKLLLAGAYDDNVLKKEIENKEAYQCVEYLGYLQRKDVYELYASSRAGLALLQNTAQYSEIDTLPTKVFEYMQMGLPVILSKTNYSERCLKEYKFGIAVNPDDLEEIAEAIQMVLDSEELQKEMEQYGKKAIAEKFNWSVEEKKLIELYQEL